MSNKGVTVIELLIVLAIISIIAFHIAFSIYEPYKKKAYVTADALPYLRTCMGDIVYFCINHPGESFNGSIFENCQNKTGIYGNVTFEVPNATCTLKGEVPEGYKVKAYSTTTEDFYAVCIYNLGGVKCFVTPSE